MSIAVLIPALCYTSLLVQNRRKAQALLTYCTTIVTGCKLSSRTFAGLIGISKSQAALWIIEFDKAIIEENRTNNGQSQNPISGTFEAQNNYIPNDKSDSNRIVSGQSADTLDGSNIAESDVSSHSPDSFSCMRDKRDPLKGFSSTSTLDSLGQHTREDKLSQMKKFEHLVRQSAGISRLKIELKSGKIATIGCFGRQILVAINNQPVKKAEALTIWQELYSYAASVLGGLEAARTIDQDHFVLLRNNELFRVSVKKAA